MKGRLLAAAAQLFGERGYDATLKWHDLRRTCGCRLLQDHGMTKDKVRDWLGHKSVVQTERAYAFLRVDDLHAAVTKTGTKRADDSA